MADNAIDFEKLDESDLDIDSAPMAEDLSLDASENLSSEITSEDETNSLETIEPALDSTENDFWISPEEFYEDCGCGLDTACLTTCSLDSDLSSTDEEANSDVESVEDFDEISDNDDYLVALEETDLRYIIRDAVPKEEEFSKVYPGDPEEDEEDSDEGEEDEVDRTCFIATAAYGNPMHQDVIQLRSFRDEWLAHRGWGRLFIKVYWKIGPLAARYVLPISRSAKLVRFVVRLVLFAFKRFR